MRTYDASLIAPAIELFLGTNNNVDPIEWLADPEHIALVNDKNDLALFEPGIKHVYSGHYYFQSRGRGAIDSGTKFLDELFNSCYNISILTGFVPINYLAAKWLSRRLGFTAYDIVDINDQQYQLFILTKEEFNK